MSADLKQSETYGRVNRAGEAALTGVNRTGEVRDGGVFSAEWR